MKHTITSDAMVEDHFESLIGMIDTVRQPPATVNAAISKSLWDKVAETTADGMGKLGGMSSVTTVDAALDMFLSGRTTELCSVVASRAATLTAHSGWLSKFAVSGTVASVQQRRRVRVRSDMGDELDRHAAIAGRHETAWTRTRQQTRMTRRAMTATLVIRTGMHSGLRSDDILWRAATAYVVADKLQRLGYSVEVLTGSVTNKLFMHHTHKYALTCLVKASTMPLSIDAVAVFASGAFHRSAIFQTYCRAGDAGWQVSSLLGFPCDELPPRIKACEQAGELVVAIPSVILNEAAAYTALRDIETLVNAHETKAAA